MPCDVAVEGPQTRIVGDEADERVRVALDDDRVAPDGVFDARATRHDVLVVVGPVEGTRARLEDPLVHVSTMRTCHQSSFCRDFAGEGTVLWTEWRKKGARRARLTKVCP